MRQLSKDIVATFCGLYGLSDWRVAVRISRAKRSQNCGTTNIRTPYKEACITLYPYAVKETKRHYPFESLESVLHHEFAHLAVAQCLPGVALTPEQEEVAVEHISEIVMRLVPNYGVNDNDL